MPHHTARGWGQRKPPLGVQLNRGHPLAQGLLAGWLYNECGGRAVYDISGNNNTGTFTHVTNDPTWAASGYRDIFPSILFTANSYISVPNIPALSGASKLTISYWVKRALSTSAVNLGQGASVAGYVSSEVWTDGNVYFEMNGGYGFASVPGTAWHHVVCIFDGTKTGNSNRMKMYVDGVLKTLTFSGTVPASVASTSGPFQMGAYLTNSYSNGNMNDVRIWNRALSDSEAQSLYLDPYASITPPRRRIVNASSGTPPVTAIYDWVIPLRRGRR